MTKYLESQPFTVALASKDYADGWERVFAKQSGNEGKGWHETPVQEDSGPYPRRPRGNWILAGGKYWVSWGPTAPRPDMTTGFDVLVPATPLRGEDGWQPLPDPTPEQWREIVNELATRLVGLGDRG